LLGAEWKALSAEKKVKYEEMAAKGKERYAEEMKNYTPPPTAKVSVGSASKKKVKKDPNAPKRATTSFFFFSSEMRAKVKEENDGITFGELGKKMGEMFKALSPKEKSKYEEMAKKDQLRYKKEFAAYKEKQSPGDDNDDDEEEEEEEESPKKSKSKKEDSDDDDDDDDDDDELDDDSDDSD
jgi:hypothetical protein